ncbi:MAG: amidohydrolase [Armatimonadetes bacterium]|nr:amidohydrolase [Armatimonadota bacterium]
MASATGSPGSKASLRLWKNARRVDPATGAVRSGSLLTWGDRIVSAGEVGDPKDLLGLPVEAVDLDGRLLLPGLTDAHCHLVRYGLDLTRTADLTGVASIEEMLHRLQVHAARTPGDWVIGRGFDQDRLRERRFPRRDELDARFPDRPVLLHRICCHAVVANRAALDRARLTSADGLFTEDAMALLLSAVPAPSLEETVHAARTAIRAYHRGGFTAAHVLIGHPDEVRALQILRQQGEMGLRLRLILPYSWIDSMEALGVSSGFGDDMLRIAALKSFADGSLGARTAALRTPYADDPENAGLLLLSAEELVERIRRAHRAGLRSALHAIGDAAVEAVLLAAERTQDDGPPPRIEHASVVDPDQAARMGRLGIAAAVQPQFIASDFWTPERLGPERSAWAYPFRTLKDAGVALAASTDCPVELPEAAAVFKGFISRSDKRLSESLAPTEALRAFTLDAERSLGEEFPAPWETGARADFLVLSKDTEWPLPVDSPWPMERIVVGGTARSVPQEL